jgi:response regulator RpfG family c-di-GMP phosphodiesterase
MEPGGERPQPLKDLRVLVVEDEVLIALDIQAILRDAGAEIVGPYATLPAALEAAESEALSAAILDIRLSDRTTEAVAARLAARDIPFLFYTGQPVPAQIRTEMPDAVVLFKPVAQPILIAKVAALARG